MPGSVQNTKVMTKKIIVFVLCTCYYSIALHAQVTTNNKELKRAGEALKLEASNNYTQALSLAKEKGWPLVIKGKNNSVSKLVGVDAFGLPRYYTTYNNTIAAATTGASQLWPGGSTGLNLSGSSAVMKNKLGIWDDGSPLTTHVELTGRVTVKDAGTPSDHATHVAGTMIATGVNPVAKGMSFGAQGIISYDFGGFTGLDVPKMFTEANNGLLLSNHSYGATAGWAFNSDSSRWEFYGEPGATEDFKFGYYDQNAMLKDSIAYNAPDYLIVTAAGNNRAENGPAVGQPYFRFNSSGKMAAAGNRPAGISSNDSYGIIAMDANAKNMLTVGAVNGIAAGYNKPGDVVMSSFSSWGPTDDGRIKPDIVADGVNVTSSIATSNNAYGTFSGTSMATPNTTGSLFLLQDYFSQLKPGTFMRSATLKGLAIHTADEAGAAPGPDYQFGWGLLDVKKAADVIKAAVISNNAATSQHLLYENVLDNAAQQTFTTTVTASGNGPLVATICWTDVKGTVDLVNKLNNTTPKLVNDLDIRITSGANTYMPWKLDPANPGNAATKGDNILDNVERINIDSVVPGQSYTITVTHKGTLVRGSQAYSLLVSGVGGTAYCVPAPGANAGAHIDSVGFSTIHNKNSATCTTYNNYTGLTADIQTNQTLPFTVNVNKCDASASSKVVKVFIDYNNNGVFTDAGELVATSTVLTGAGTQSFSGNIIIPSGLQTGNFAVMRVVAQETTDPATVLPCGSANAETQDYRVRIVQPANDAAISTLVAPISGGCSNASQYVVATIQNKGSIDLTDIPVTAIVKNGAAVIATINNTYRGTIAAGSSVTYTFQTAFSTVPGTTYTITTYTAAPGDQSLSNDTLTSTVSIPASPAGPAASATICGSQANLKVISPVAGASYFWYPSATGNTPLTTGATAATATITSDKTYYVSSGVAAASLGPVNKAALGVGGYNNFAGNFVAISASVPVTINFAKLYIGNPGPINFVVADTLSGNRYIPLSSVTIDAYVTNPSGTGVPATGATSNPDIPSDTGAYFYLNLAVPAGDHVIFINPQSPAPTATIFRNNGVSGNPYPFSIPGVFAITANSAGTTFQNFYYFFYDMKIKTDDCPSARTAVLAGTATAPTISQVGDSLVSTATNGNQWYLNNVAIPNATGKSIKPVTSGFYSVIATDPSGCALGSNSINFVSTATVDLNGTQIGLVVSPNPSNGLFNMVFEVKERADLSIEVLNMLGQNIYLKTIPGFIGRFSDQIKLPNAAAGTYILKIWHHNNLYVKKLQVSK